MRKKKTTEFDRGVIVGIGLACSIGQSSHDNPVIFSEVLMATCLDRRKMKAAGVEYHDLKALRPVFAEVARRTKSKRRLKWSWNPSPTTPERTGDEK